MQFDLAHIWATMGLLSKLVALTLALMGLASTAVVVERLIVLGRIARDTARFTVEAKPHFDAWDTGAVIGLAERHGLSALARLVAAALKRFDRGVRMWVDYPVGNNVVRYGRAIDERESEAFFREFKRALESLPPPPPVESTDPATTARG